MCLVHPPVSLSEMRSRVSALEEELRAKAGTLKSIENEMVQSKKELAARDLSIQRARDELTLAHTRMAQESERVKTDTSATDPTSGNTPPTITNETNLFHNSANVFSVSPVSAALGCWPHFLKTFNFDFPENYKHVGNILLVTRSLIISKFEKVELEKCCPCSVCSAL